jgi:type III restriction enzyme
MPEQELTLSREYSIISNRGLISRDVPKFIIDNLNSRYELRHYQIEAVSRFIHYFEKEPNRIKPTQLLFNMATGSGKTLLMAANILYLYSKGYRHFLFFVNSTNIIEKTRDNFLNFLSSKYLFNEKIKFKDREVQIREVSNFDEANENDINIVFTTIQGLHSQLNLHRENLITIEDFRDKKIVLISDEAHHINAWTRNGLNNMEREMKNTWEGTVMSIFNSNPENVLLEYTATIDMENPNIFEKYKDRIIFEYDLKQFRIDGYSKEVKVLQADLDNRERMLQAAVLSQYRRKIAEKNRIRLKPVVLFKSRSIKESKENYTLFRKAIDNLSEKDLEKVKSNAGGTVLEKAFSYFENSGITLENLSLELQEDFSEEKCILLDSENIDRDKQLRLNTLEDENNEVRAVFAVNMLNEGWDVLNLFDIVRLYDTRDARGNRPGKTTIAEAQLIGRGARYYPFKAEENDDPYRRKFDNDIENELKILEELYYHSSHNPRYIQELTTVLKESGIMPHETKEVELKVKEEVKRTGFWKNGLIFVNKRRKVDRSRIRTVRDIDTARAYACRLLTGFSEESAVLEENPQDTGNEAGRIVETVTRMFRLGDFGDAVIRKAMARLDFYRFNNLKKYFPSLESSLEFISSLKEINADVSASRERLDSLTPEDKLHICMSVLAQLKQEILKNYNEYEGTKVFMPKKVRNLLQDKKVKIDTDDGSDKELGKPMSDPTKTNIPLDLSVRDWYVYNENYGTSEEKYFVRFIDGIIDRLKELYSEIYLVRNAKLFQIYRFSDGKALEPDFVLFLKKEGSDDYEQYQVFVEAKGEHLFEKDRWKEEFLKEIESGYEIDRILFGENEKYKIIGLPFYNESRKAEFSRILKEKLGIESGSFEN